MRVEFAPDFFKGFIHAAAGGRGTHDLFDRNFRGSPVIGCHAVTHVAFGHNPDQATALFVFHDRRAPASRLAHRQRSLLGCLARRAARIYLNRFHLVLTTTHLTSP
jgi:hypothetical protein